jgi:Kef-type K+ transport system membrane component KefB
VLLTFFFSGESTGPGVKLVLLGGFAVLVVVAGLPLARLERSMRLEGVLVRMQDTTAEIRVRFAILLLVAFVALAERLGLETILGGFIAGASWSAIGDRLPDRLARTAAWPHHGCAQPTSGRASSRRSRRENG